MYIAHTLDVPPGAPVNLHIMTQERPIEQKAAESVLQVFQTELAQTSALFRSGCEFGRKLVACFHRAAFYTLGSMSKTRCLLKHRVADVNV